MANRFMMNRSPVYGEEFYNRTRELKKIFGWINTKIPQDVSIISSDRMGASSLLLHFCKAYGPSRNPDYKFIYFDLHKIQTRAGFLKQVIKEMGCKGNSYEDLEKCIRKQKTKIILCLDNFGKSLTKPNEFNIDFFDFMRSLTVQNTNLCYVTLTPKHLKEMGIPYNPDAGSEFYNIFQRIIELNDWDYQTKKQYIGYKFSDVGFDVSESDIDFIISESKGSPFQLIVFMEHFYEGKSNNLSKAKIKQAYRIDIKRNSKKRNSLFSSLKKKMTAKTILLFISLGVIVYWLIFSVPRDQRIYSCKGSFSKNIEISLEFPISLARGDLGTINVSAQNTSTTILSPLLVIDFNKNIDLKINSSNKIDYEELDISELRTSEVQFFMPNYDLISIKPKLTNGTEILKCELINQDGSPEIKRAPIPYFMTLWVWLGASGPISLIGPYILNLVKEKLSDEK